MNLDKRTQGERLEIIMNKSGLNQTDFGLKIGCDQSKVSKLLKSNEIGATYCWRLVCNFDINPKWLEYGQEPMIIDYEALKNGENNKNSELIETQRELISMLKEKVCELKSQLQEANHALKNTVGAD